MVTCTASRAKQYIHVCIRTCTNTYIPLCLSFSAYIWLGTHNTLYVACTMCICCICQLRTSGCVHLLYSQLALYTQQIVVAATSSATVIDQHEGYGRSPDTPMIKLLVNYNYTQQFRFHAKKHTHQLSGQRARTSPAYVLAWGI